MSAQKPVPKLLQFLRDNRDAPRAALTVKNEGEGEAASATVYLYDVIDAYWGISAESFAKTLAGITAPTVHLRVNSPGGDVFEARAMVAAIRAFPGTVISYVDGLAASAATYVAMAASRVEMTQGAFLMIHNAWTLSYGNAADLRSMADLLDKIDASIVHDYKAKTGKDDATLQAWMAAETWFSADEAKAEGFVDIVIDPADSEPAPAAKWNLASFDKAPKALLEREAANAAAQHEGEALRAAAQRRLALLEKVPA